MPGYPEGSVLSPISPVPGQMVNRVPLCLLNGIPLSNEPGVPRIVCYSLSLSRHAYFESCECGALCECLDLCPKCRGGIRGSDAG